MNLEAFTQIKLKKVNLVEKPVRNLICTDSNKYNELTAETFFEKYYDAIAPFTFASDLLSLSHETAISLLKSHEDFIENKACGLFSFWSEKYPLLLELANQLTKMQEKNQWKSSFIRLSIRSPKDSVLTSVYFRDLFCEALKKLDYDANNPTQELNARMHALYIASTKCMLCRNGIDAVTLFVQSKRIQNDLRQFVEGIVLKTNCVLREFRFFEPELEFRGFVYEGKFTACTQYNEAMHFKRVCEQFSMLKSVIIQSFADMLPKIGISSYVVDFILISETPDQGEFSNLRLYICEINPFAEFVGSGLFSWVDDFEILTGTNPFEFRVVTKVPVNARNLIGEIWAEMLNLD